jgi:hypothetical protein
MHTDPATILLNLWENISRTQHQPKLWKTPANQCTLTLLPFWVIDIREQRKNFRLRLRARVDFWPPRERVISRGLFSGLPGRTGCGMKTLFLIGHAKSSWDDTALPDKDGHWAIAAGATRPGDGGKDPMGTHRILPAGTTTRLKDTLATPQWGIPRRITEALVRKGNPPVIIGYE